MNVQKINLANKQRKELSLAQDVEIQINNEFPYLKELFSKEELEEIKEQSCTYISCTLENHERYLDNYQNCINDGITYTLESKDSMIIDAFERKTEECLRPIGPYGAKDLKELISAHMALVTLSPLLEGIRIRQIILTGSRTRGYEQDNSDLDVLIFYTGDIKEDDFFNILASSPLEICGVKVDFNPTQLESNTMGQSMLKLLAQEKFMDDAKKLKEEIA